MRRELVIGKWAAIAGVLIVGSACSPQCGPSAKTPVKTTPVAAVPSPSHTPTAPLQASSPPFHGGEVGVAYGAVALSASGGIAPYTWTVSTGALPGGLTLGPNGSVAGTPTSAGSFSFTFQVADAGNSTASIPGTIGIAPALTAGLIPACSQYCNVELGCVSVCGGFGQLSGGVGPYSYSLTQGPLPAGTSLNGLSLDGMFKGTSGWLQFTVQVSDALGATASISPKFWMYDHISLASGGCSVFYGTPCTTQLHISGGIPNDHFTVQLMADSPPRAGQGCGSYGPEPAGSLGVSGSEVVINIPGIWPSSSGYGAIWTLQVTDSALCGPSTYCSSNQATAVVEVQCG